MRIAAFDPAIALTGYAIVEDRDAIAYGVISTPAKTFEGDRCLEIYRDAVELLAEYQPDQVAYEKPFFRGYKTNASIVQYAVGALMMAFSTAGYKTPLMVNTAQVKMYATGSGKADKALIKPAVLEYYGITHRKGDKDDVYDALACAIAAQNLIAANAA